MVEKFDQVLQEHVLSKHGQNGQRHCVARHRKQGFRGVSKPFCGMFREIAAAKQGPFQQITAATPVRRHPFEDDSFIAPYK